jgi:transposase
VVDAEGTPGVPKVLACANTRAGYPPWCTTLTEATAQAGPTKVTVGCEATGPYWLGRYEAFIAQGYRGRVLHPCYVKARRGSKTAAVAARLLNELLQREHGPSAPVPEAMVPGLRAVTRMRADVVSQSGDMQRRLSRMLDRTFPAFATAFRDVWGQAARPVVEMWPWPAPLAAVPTAPLATLLARLSHGHGGTEQARAVREAAQPRSGVRRAADALACALRLWLRQLRELEHRIARSPVANQLTRVLYAVLSPRV